MAKKEEEFVKVQFYDPAVGYENLWATGRERNHYRIESISFFIYGVLWVMLLRLRPTMKGDYNLANWSSHLEIEPCVPGLMIS
jgi:hypothetical protein